MVMQAFDSDALGFDLNVGEPHLPFLQTGHCWPRRLARRRQKRTLRGEKEAWV